MSKAPVTFREARKIWKDLAVGETQQDMTAFELKIHKKLLKIFQVGDYYYYIFNVRQSCFELMSKEVEQVLGYKPEVVDIPFFLDKLIHPEDQPWFIRFEGKVKDFFHNLTLEQIPNYKVRYDYRVKKSNGEYIRILHQVVTMQYNKEGGVVRTFGVHTDISHLKKEGKPVLSFIGLNGEPSYIDVDTEQQELKPASLLTPREREILSMIADGKGSKEIACELFISKETVHTHRRNLLSKMGVVNTAQLIRKATREGWI